MPGATLTSRPRSPELTTSCKAENQKTGDGFVVDIHRFADAASGSGPARAQSYFERYCTETYSGGWAPDDPSAPPTPSVGERACGKAGGTAALLVLQERNVVHIWSTGWDPPVWPSLPGKETELARHVLQRLETLE